MHGPLGYENLLFYVQLAALVGVAVRLIASGLASIYRFFAVYLIVQIIEGLIPILIRNRPHSNAYGYLFLATEGVLVLLYALIVLELYSLVFRDLSGIATIARRFIKIAIALAITVALMILVLEPVPPGILPRFYTFQSTIVSSLVLFVFLITGFLVYYPIPLNRNVIYYSIGYAFYFTSKALLLILHNTGHGQNRALSFAMLAVSTACLLFWIFALSPRGEKKTVIFGHQWNLKDEQHLLQQLREFNETLLRARK